jgi:hypothetical protein
MKSKTTTAMTLALLLGAGGLCAQESKGGNGGNSGNRGNSGNSGNSGGSSSRAGALEFHQRQFPTREGRGKVLITVKRVGGRAGEVSVEYDAKAGTATAPDDFKATNGKLTWLDGDRRDKSFEIEIVNDSTRERNETILLSLANPTGGARLGRELSRAVAMILDDENDGGGAGEFHFDERHFEVNEGAGKVRIAVERSRGSRGEVKVDYAVKPGTATPGEDYTPTSGTLTWPDGDEAKKTFEVTILEDTVDEGKEMALLELANPTGGAVIRAERGDAAIVIEDNDGDECEEEDDNCEDGPGVFKFDESSFEVSESVGKAIIRVERSDGETGAVTVDYAVENGTAKAGEDYTSVSGTLSWADGEEADKTFEVPITDDAAAEPSESVKLILKNATGGAKLHPNRAQSTLIIRASD